jgi:uncharacterized protein YlxP (DUF503 family)
MIHETNSLKEKRHVLKSVIEWLKSRFNVSVAETGLNDKWQAAEIGVSCVSNDRVLIDKTMNSIINFIENDYRVEITDYSIEIY